MLVIDVSSQILNVTYALVPASGLLVSCTCTGVITKLDFIQLGEILLVSGRTAEIALAAVV